MSNSTQSKYAWEGPVEKVLLLALSFLVVQKTLSFLSMWASAGTVGWIWTMLFVGSIFFTILWAAKKDPGYGSDHDWWE